MKIRLAVFQAIICGHTDWLTQQGQKQPRLVCLYNIKFWRKRPIWLEISDGDKISKYNKDMVALSIYLFVYQSVMCPMILDGTIEVDNKVIRNKTILKSRNLIQCSSADVTFHGVMKIWHAKHRSPFCEAVTKQMAYRAAFFTLDTPYVDGPERYQVATKKQIYALAPT